MTDGAGGWTSPSGPPSGNGPRPPVPGPPTPGYGHPPSGYGYPPAGYGYPQPGYGHPPQPPVARAPQRPWPSGADRPRTYPQLLRGPRHRWWRPLLALLTAVLAGVVLVVAFAVVALVVVALTQGLDSFDRVSAELSDEAFYSEPWGFLLNNLVLAALIPVSMGTVWLVHGWRPRWLSSVRPGLRWGWTAECTAWSLLVVALALVAGLVSGESLEWRPQPQFWFFVAVVLLTQPLQAAGEEYAFRGLLTQSVGSLFARAGVAAVVGGLVSATLFALAHGSQSPWLFADRFAFGVIASYLTWRTGGLEAGIALHTVNNVYAIGIALVTGTLADSITVTDYPATSAVLDVVLLGLLAVALTWRARRRDLQRVHDPALQPGGGTGPGPAAGTGAWAPYAVLAQGYPPSASGAWPPPAQPAPAAWPPPARPGPAAWPPPAPGSGAVPPADPARRNG